jgi:D-3-phosphoglycerate dehydrogenase
MVGLFRHIPDYTAAYRADRQPQPLMGRELRGSTLGVIGCGLIGREVCRLAAAFGMRILVADPHSKAGEGVVQLSLPELLQQADVVVCLAAATADTENLMNAQAFASMKRGAFFINAARGNLVDEQALLDALDAGQLAGCAIDVGRAPDQMPSALLARHPSVIATPHVGGLTRPATDFQALQAVRQVESILAGRIPEGAVNAPYATRCAFREHTR